MSKSAKLTIITALLTIYAVSFYLAFLADNVHAATGINDTINFQGKVVNADGTNVADGTYDFDFAIYTVDSGGVAIWTESWDTGTAQVTVTDGIFRVALGTHTDLPGSVDFNTDNIYLGITFNNDADGEMSPRVRFAAVPYAFNAQKVAGLTVTDTNATLTISNDKTLTVSDTTTLATNSITFGGTQSLTLAATKNVSFADSFTTSGANPLTLTTTGSTNVTLPTAGTLFSTQTSSAQGDIIYASANNTLGLLNKGNDGECLKATTTTIQWGVCAENGSLFTDDGTFTYLNATGDDLVLGASTVANAAFYMQVTDGGSPAYSTLFLGTNEAKNGRITFYSSGVGETDPSIYADANGNLVLSAPGGTVDIGTTSGDIEMSLLTVNDNFIADKTITLTAAYSQNDFTFRRVLTSDAGGETQSGSLVYIEDAGDGTGTTVNGDLLKVNSALTAGTFTGNLLNLQLGGTDKFTVNSAGQLTVTDSSTTASGKSISVVKSGAVSGTSYGIHSAVSGASTTNVGGYLTASGATNNYALQLVGAGVGSGSLYGVDINAITGGAGTEVAINIGSGWDTAVNINSGALGLNSNSITSTGAITLTAASASTWSTSNGVLSLTGDDGLTLTASSTAGITGNIPDNLADAWDVQQGANNYININTTDSSERVTIGNSTATNTGVTLDINGTGTILLPDFANCSALETSSSVLTCGVDDGGGGAVWSALGVPTTDLTLAMDADATVFNWDTMTTQNAFTFATAAAGFTSGDLVRMHQSASLNDAVTASGNLLDISRALTIDVGGATSITVSSPVVTITDNCTTGASDTCTHSGALMSLTQSFASSTGNGITLSHSGTGTGLSIASANASGTRTSGILINQSGAGTLTNGLNITESAGTITNGINIGSGVGTAIVMQNGETINNSSDGTITFGINAGTLSFTADTLSSSGALNFSAAAASTWTLANATNSLNIDSNTLVIDASNNRVGIGTNSPSNKLTVAIGSVGDGFSVEGNSTGFLSPQFSLYDTTTQKGAFGLALDNNHYSSISGPGDIVIRALDAANGDVIISSQNSGGGIKFATGTSSANDTAKMVIQNDGNVGIGDTSPDASLDVNSTATSGNIMTVGADTAVTLGGNLSGLSIDMATNYTPGSNNRTGVNIANISGGGSTETAISIGTGWDVGLAIASGGITISGGSFQYSGSARPSKTIVLSPEYGGAVLTTFYGGGTDTNITGNLTSDAETTAANELRTYYQWERTTDATLHYYTVAVRVTLPPDFDAWQTSDAIQVEFVTDTTGTTANVLDVRIYNENNTTTAVATSTGNASGTADTWTTVSIDDSALDETADSGVTEPEFDEAAETALIYLRMGSASSEHVRVGDIRLNYLSRY